MRLSESGRRARAASGSEREPYLSTVSDGSEIGDGVLSGVESVGCGSATHQSGLVRRGAAPYKTHWSRFLSAGDAEDAGASEAQTGTYEASSRTRRILRDNH